MDKALVLGASGGIGYAIVMELVSRGIEVVAFSRSRNTLESLFGNQSKVTIFAGDALKKQDLLEATEGVDLIFHALNFPYHEWERKQLPCLEGILEVAKNRDAKIAFVDNVYAYGKQTGLVTEESAKNPHTKKGKIRLAMENMLRSSSVPALTAHMPDVYGPNAPNTIIHETLKNVVQHKKANFIGPLNVGREFLYTIDGAKAMVELTLRDDCFNQSWNIPAIHPITGTDILQTLSDITGTQPAVRSISTNMIRLLGLFSPQMKEMVEMMYLTEEPVVLSGAKYEEKIGKQPSTSYREGLKETIRLMQK